MKKKFNLTAILAVVMVAMLSINLVSCTADDEYDNCFDGAYTLAQGIFDLNEEGRPASDNLTQDHTYNLPFVLLAFEPKTNPNNDYTSLRSYVSFAVTYSNDKNARDLRVSSWSNAFLNYVNVKQKLIRDAKQKTNGNKYISFKAELEGGQIIHRSEDVCDTILYRCCYEGEILCDDNK